MALKYSLYRYLGPKVCIIWVHGPLGVSSSDQKKGSMFRRGECVEDSLEPWGVESFRFWGSGCSTSGFLGSRA